MKPITLRISIVALAAGTLAAIALLPLQAQAPSWDGLDDGFTKDVRPLLLNYCKRCHGPKRQEADLDLAGFAKIADVHKATHAWQKVLEMLETEQMPPLAAKQPSADERARLKTWVRSFLKAEARARAGDPGRVVLRRLSNAEYTYTIRDLTGLASLQPAREFPVDGAAGEGFTNTGDALAMSPALFTKYLTAAKGIAAHAVFLPDGLRFSPFTTRRDWTNEVLGEIRALYNKYSDASASTKLNLQGVVFDAKQGGRLPLEKYLTATLAERNALLSGQKSVKQVAQERELSPKYLGLLWEKLNDPTPSLLLDDLRERWRRAKADDAVALAASIAPWQKSLWKLNSVGHIGKLGGPKSWLEPVQPFVARQSLRLKLPQNGAGASAFYLVAVDLGDGNDHDFVVWQEPKFVAPGRPDLLLKDVRRVSRELSVLRAGLFAATAKYLRAANEAAATEGNVDIKELARKHSLEDKPLRAWLDVLGLSASGPVKVEGYLTKKIMSTGSYPFIQGWATPEGPNVVANSSDKHVRIPGNMRPHGVCIQPAPKVTTIVGWQSPIAGKLRVSATVAHAHPNCGYHVNWSLELRRGEAKLPLAGGVVNGAHAPKIELIDITVRTDDLLVFSVAPPENQTCALTAVDLTLTSGEKTWDLAKDVADNVLAGNPHADRLGNKAVWHFFSETAVSAKEPRFAIAKGSLLDRWTTANEENRTKLAGALEQLLIAGTTPKTTKADAELYHRLASLNGPLLSRLWKFQPSDTAKVGSDDQKDQWGLDPARFGVHPKGQSKVAAASLCVQAPSVIEVRVPGDLVDGYELVTTAVLHASGWDSGSVQVQIAAKPQAAVPSRQPGLPILVAETGAARKRLTADVNTFRDLFPPAVCYTKIVPVDEVVTLTLFYREDHLLARLMLDDAERRQLDRLWAELEFVSRFPLTQVDAFTQLLEFASQDGDPKLFEPMRKPIYEKAAAFRKTLVDTEPKHLDAILDFAGRACRRPLTSEEKQSLTALYHQLRKQALPHEEAARLTLTRVLVAPVFLYRLEKPPAGTRPAPVSDWELASRLSYFLWSSMPDEPLTETAKAGTLSQTLVPQMHRMLKDPRTRRLAIEFACQWLHIRGFDELNEKSERHFPTFAGLRGDMYEESIRFFTDLFQRDGSVLDILDADYTFVDEALAKHYAIPGVAGSEWRRIDGVKKYGRGGIIGQATVLATQSGASRTSPILRGNWVSEVLLGEKLPRPPKGVPQLPDDETMTEGLTVRQLIEKHTSDAKCAVCHRRIDAYGFALEGFDAIGRRRDKDLGDRPIDTHAKTMDGAEFTDIDGLRHYLLTTRKDAFVRQFCRKLLGYALARGVQLADEPLLDDMQEQLKAHGYKISVALEAIVKSPQFREIRGSEFKNDE